MRRLLRIRLPLLLFGLAAIPLATLPFAERLRSEWARYSSPRVEDSDDTAFQDDFIPDFSAGTRNVSLGCFIVVPALAVEETDRLNRERGRIEAERRQIGNEPLAQEVADSMIE